MSRGLVRTLPQPAAPHGYFMSILSIQSLLKHLTDSMVSKKGWRTPEACSNFFLLILALSHFIFNHKKKPADEEDALWGEPTLFQKMPP